MARVLITDGLDVKRESASIETFKPAAAESRSLKTPTTCGRLSPSMTRGSEPVALKVVRVGFGGERECASTRQISDGCREQHSIAQDNVDPSGSVGGFGGRQWQQIRSGAHRRHPGRAVETSVSSRWRPTH